MASPALKHSETTAAAPASPHPAEPLLTLNDLLWCLYLYPLRVMAALVPRVLLYGIGRLAEPIIQLYWRERKRDLVRRILSSRCPSLTPDRARRIARRYASRALFRGLDDLILCRRSSLRRLHCTAIEGLDHLERARSAGKGVVILSAHFSANRIGRRYLAEIGYPMLTLRRSVLYHHAGRLGRRFLQAPYKKFQHQLIPDEVAPEDPECSLKVLQRLRSGGLAHFHYDVRRDSNFVRGEFLGLPRQLPVGVFHIIRLSGCPVVPMLCLGNSAGFRIGFSPPLNIVSAATPDEFIALNQPTFVANIERQIAEHPEEWVLWNRL